MDLIWYQGEVSPPPSFPTSHSNNLGLTFPCRYISSDSHLIKAYGFVDVDYDKETLSVEEKLGSYYFFIPQVITFTFLRHAHDLGLEVFWSAFVQYKFNAEVILYSDRHYPRPQVLCTIHFVIYLIFMAVFHIVTLILWYKAEKFKVPSVVLVLMFLKVIC